MAGEVGARDASCPCKACAQMHVPGLADAHGGLGGGGGRPVRADAFGGRDGFVGVLAAQGVFYWVELADAVAVILALRFG